MVTDGLSEMDLVRWKGRFSTGKQLERRVKQRNAGLNSRKRKLEEGDDSKNPSIVVGRRIVDIEVMSKHLHCTSCKGVLSLEHIEKETKKGLASMFFVRCTHCLAVNSVPTSKQHWNAEQSTMRFDTNTKAALACLHSGLGCESMNKFLNVLNIPGIPHVTYKRHEREIGPFIEHVAKKSCSEACAEERVLTLSNVEELKKLL